MLNVVRVEQMAVSRLRTSACSYNPVSSGYDAKPENKMSFKRSLVKAGFCNPLSWLMARVSQSVTFYFPPPSALVFNLHRHVHLHVMSRPWLARRRGPIFCQRNQPDPENSLRHWTIVGSMLGQRRRRWTNIDQTMAQCLMFAGDTDPPAAPMALSWHKVGPASVVTFLFLLQLGKQ